MQTLVLGLGNPILTDDGVGVLVAEAVRQALPPEWPVEVSEVSVGGLRLMERLLGYERVILVDAFQPGDPLEATGDYCGQPGTFRRLTLSELKAIGPTQHSVSAHDTSLVTALEMAEQMGLPAPREIVIYGVAVEEVLAFGECPTPAVAAAIPVVAAAVMDELKACFAFRRDTVTPTASGQTRGHSTQGGKL
jgi:hydrogenase maturation protease